MGQVHSLSAPLCRECGSHANETGHCEGCSLPLTAAAALSALRDGAAVTVTTHYMSPTGKHEREAFVHARRDVRPVASGGSETLWVLWAPPLEWSCCSGQRRFATPDTGPDVFDHSGVGSWAIDNVGQCGGCGTPQYPHSGVATDPCRAAEMLDDLTRPFAAEHKGRNWVRHWSSVTGQWWPRQQGSTRLEGVEKLYLDSLGAYPGHAAVTDMAAAPAGVDI